jgi:broad specificity phosphatase PhoE
MQRDHNAQPHLMNRRTSFRVLATLVALVFVAPACAQSGGRQTTVILVRHAEKAAEPASDPPLTAEGKARAEALWMAVKDAGVSAVVTTQFARTVQTAAPTVSQLGLTPDVVNAGGANHPAQVASLIKTKHAGQVVLVVGHSNTVPGIIAALGAKEPPAICDEAYDNFYVVTIDGMGKASLIHSRFGVATPVGAACGAMK